MFLKILKSANNLKDEIKLVRSNLIKRPKCSTIFEGEYTYGILDLDILDLTASSAFIPFSSSY